LSTIPSVVAYTNYTCHYRLQPIVETDLWLEMNKHIIKGLSNSLGQSMTFYLVNP